jgi:hypothetical protein
LQWTNCNIVPQIEYVYKFIYDENHVCRFHYPLPPMCETKNLKPLWINRIYPFSQQYLQKKANKIFQSLKDFFKNDDIIFWIFKFSKFDENTYILSLRSKLTKLHIILKQTPKT